MDGKTPLPPEQEEHVVDVSLRHLLLAFGGLTLAAVTVGSTLILVREYTRTRRQQALIDSATKLILTISTERRDACEQIPNAKRSIAPSALKTS